MFLIYGKPQNALAALEQVLNIYELFGTKHSDPRNARSPRRIAANECLTRILWLVIFVGEEFTALAQLHQQKTHLQRRIHTVEHY